MATHSKAWTIGALNHGFGPARHLEALGLDEQVKKIIDDYVRGDFPKEYNLEDSRRVWKRHSENFRTFWDSRIMSSTQPLSEDEMIPIIQILDIKGKRRSDQERGVEGTAFTNIFQGTWYDVLRGIQSDRRIKSLIDRIFRTDSESERSKLLDELKETNVNIGALTGENATIMNDFMFVFAPDKNISMVSLSDRYKAIDFFGLGNSLDFQSVSWGERITITKQKILSLNEKLGLETDGRGVCMFLYSPRIKRLWKQEILAPTTSRTKETRRILQDFKSDHAVGDIINFRDMVYGPAEENGVIFLFSKITNDIGIKIEGIQKHFPDALAIKYNEKNGRGHRVFIEFEYMSSDFKQHHHLEEMAKGKPCDMIVCWEDDWKDRPKDIQVLELKRLINELPEETS